MAEEGITIDDIQNVIEKEYGLKEFLRHFREMEKRADVFFSQFSAEIKAHEKVLAGVKGETAEMKRLSARIEAIHQRVEELHKEAASMADVKAVGKKLDDLAARVKKLEK